MPLTDRMDRLTRQKQAALEKAKAADPQLRKLRSERDRAILQGGKILEAAKMLQWDPSTLLGALLEIAAQAEQDPDKIIGKAKARRGLPSTRMRNLPAQKAMTLRHQQPRRYAGCSYRSFGNPS